MGVSVLDNLLKLVPRTHQGAAGWRFGLRILTITSLGIALSGCFASLQEGPTRLYTIDEEAGAARAALSDLEAHYSTSTEPDRTAIRNEIIGQRLHAIDVFFARYDESLTKDSQQAGFLADVTSQGLNTAGALFTPVQTTRILSGVAGAVTGTKNAYQNDVIVAKTIQIVQAQMQANRDAVLTRIFTRMGEPTSTYPLSIALTDVEDYYRAGTFTEGLIQTAGTVGASAAIAQGDKNAVSVIYKTKYSTDAATTALWNYLYPHGRNAALDTTAAKKLNGLLADTTKFPVNSADGQPWIVQNIMFGAATASLRQKLAKAAGLL
jgi:hypothetical protein